MQSSYNVIKGNLVETKKVVAPPSFEKIYSGLVKNSTELDINQIIEQIKADAVRESQAIINEAKKNAQEIIKNAEVSSQEIKLLAKKEGFEEGYKQGLQEGYNQGLNDAQSQASEIIKKANDYYVNVQEDILQYISQKEKEIISLSIDIAKEILKSELSINQDAIIKIAEKLISKAKEKNNIILKASIEDYKILRKRKEELSVFLDNTASLMIVADTDLNNGDLVLESSNGIIDATLETQISTIASKILRE